MYPGFNPSYPQMVPFMPPQSFAAPFKLPPNQNLATLYVGDLEEQISEELLYPIFQKFGPIYSLKVMRDRTIRKSRGFGFITYYNKNDADTAKNSANHLVLLEKPIRVASYINRKENPSGFPGCDVFLRDLDKSIKIEDIDKVLGQFGKIFSSKISLYDNGESRGYGYVHFEKAEEAQACLDQNGKVVVVNANSSPFTLNIERYLPKTSRANNSNQNNLYVKNLPKKPEIKSEEEYEAELAKELQDKLSQGGKHKIGSFLLKKDPQGRYFSFACYETHEDADAILNELNNKKTEFECALGASEALYINKAEKKAIRIKNLSERKFARNNGTNLFTKGLKKTTQKEDLEKAFSQFGKITSCKVVDPSDARIDTRFGFINYDSKDDAHTALVNAKDRPDIRELYANDVYVNWHHSKEQHKRGKEAKYRNPMMGMGGMGGMPFGFPMGPMPFNMDMNPYMMMPPMQQNFGGFRPDMGYQGRQPRVYEQQMGGSTGQRPGGFQGGNPRPPYVPRGGYQGGAPRGKPYGNRQYGDRFPPGAGGRPPRGNPMGGSAPGNVNIEKPLSQTAPTQIPIVPPTSLRDNMQEFLKLDINKQRETLGNMLFPKIKKYADDVLAPKITGMLIDFSVFEVQDIVEFLENEESLKEKIQEAKELIITQEQQEQA